MPEQIEQPPQAQPAGLSENATCGLAYLTFIPAIIFLVTAPYNQNPKIRLHSWQSIFLAIAAIAASIALTVIWMIPVVNLINIVLQPVVWLAFFALWLVVMINAFVGKTIKIPLLYDLAAKQAGM